MAHNPVNHPARPIYRAIGGLTGLYLVIFGVLGLIETGGSEFFAQDQTTTVLGQGTNLGHAVFAVVLGVIILIATGVGRNIDATVNKWFGYLLMAVALAGLAVIRTDANFLNFTIPGVVVTMLAGLVLLMAGMYGRVGSADEARAWRDGRLLL
jgi:RsiW-degrading membrane proteinase PrsW (M82 family)